MSMTKAGANYARHMDEVFEQERRGGYPEDDYLLYQEYCYLMEQEERRKESPLKPLFDGMAAAYKQLNNNH